MGDQAVIEDAVVGTEKKIGSKKVEYAFGRRIVKEGKDEQILGIVGEKPTKKNVNQLQKIKTPHKRQVGVKPPSQQRSHRPGVMQEQDEVEEGQEQFQDLMIGGVNPMGNETPE